MQKQIALDPTNDSNFIAVDTKDHYAPVLSAKKTPLMFASLKTGKKYLSKRFKDTWSEKQFQMAKYALEPGTEVTFVD